jgi:hypothetical protein
MKVNKMSIYFMPDKLENCNYYITRKLKNGTLIRDQLPSEGIYTEYEMSNILDDIPGKWIKTPANNKGYIWGLRKLFDVTNYKIVKVIK